MASDDRTASPTAVLAAMAVEGCLEAIDKKLGPLDEIKRHVLICGLSKVVAGHLEREVMLLLTGQMH